MELQLYLLCVSYNLRVMDAAGCSICLRNLLSANSGAVTSSDPQLVTARARAAQKLPNSIGGGAASISLPLGSSPRG